MAYEIKDGGNAYTLEVENRTVGGNVIPINVIEKLRPAKFHIGDNLAPEHMGEITEEQITPFPIAYQVFVSGQRPGSETSPS